MSRWVVLGLCLMAGPALGATYKCQDGGGGVVFSDSPCGQSAPVISPPATADNAVEGLRPGEKKRLRDIEAREAAAQKESRKQQADEKAAQRSAESAAKSCRSAKRHIAEIEEELRQGYKAKRGEKLQRKLGEYKDDAAIYCKQ